MSDPEGEDKKPWDDRRRVVPLRTYSGTVKYRKRQHGWTAADFLRIAEKMGDIAMEDVGLVRRLWNAYVELVRRWLYIVFSFWGEVLGWEELRRMLFELASLNLDFIKEAIYRQYIDPQERRQMMMHYLEKVSRIFQ